MEALACGCFNVPPCLITKSRFAVNIVSRRDQQWFDNHAEEVLSRLCGSPKVSSVATLGLYVQSAGSILCIWVCQGLTAWAACVRKLESRSFWCRRITVMSSRPGVNSYKYGNLSVEQGDRWLITHLLIVGLLILVQYFKNGRKYLLKISIENTVEHMKCLLSLNKVASRFRKAGNLNMSRYCIHLSQFLRGAYICHVGKYFWLCVCIFSDLELSQDLVWIIPAVCSLMRVKEDLSTA